MNKATVEKMREVLEIRGYSPATITSYMFHIRKLTEYFNKSPEELALDQIHEYQVYLVHHKKVCWSSFNQAVCSFKFFLTM